MKSKQRVAEHGEVFTAEREVKAMCDLVADECTRIESKFLEPACGEGNFLIEILKRKLQTVKSNFQKNFSECERNSLIALSSLYGIDILEDNVKICRENLFNLWDEFYSAIAPSSSDSVRDSARFILEKNIICGDSINGT
ncbi:MAG: N-6 DNA methylase, partial [Synergistaceae bacterium]|nr:N-6 DNA methylase [Synergistaceae bacterium]